MFCIAAFIILLILSAFSAKYRTYLKKAWGCTFRRVTLRACDTSFKEDLKNNLLSKVAVKNPRWVKGADIGLEVGAFLVIVLTIWSLYVVVKGGINYFVYDTCYPSNASACSLGAEACSVGGGRLTFIQSLQQGQPQQWFVDEATEVRTTLSDIPARLRTWQAEDYLPQVVTYRQPFNQDNPTAVKIIDPGCSFCRQLSQNIQTTNFTDRYNLTYILYPIHDGQKYKFPHSYHISRLIEASRQQPPAQLAQTIPADWFILDQIFTAKDANGASYQDTINNVLTDTQVDQLLDQWLTQAGYTSDEINQLRQLADSAAIADRIAAHKQIVETQVRTRKIPTLIFNNRRHTGAVSVDQLR